MTSLNTTPANTTAAERTPRELAMLFSVDSVRFASAPAGELCDSLAHDLNQRPAATFAMFATLSPNIVANVNLCAACAAEETH